VKKQRIARPSAPDRDTEQRILAAAREVFIRRGTAGARMQEIAEEAGVNQALLHYYFRSKDRLAEAVFSEVAGRLGPAIGRVLGSDDPLEKKVEQFVHLYIDTARKHPYIPGYVLAELHHQPDRVAAMVARIAGGSSAPVAQPILARIGSQLEELAARGVMRPIAPEQFLTNLIALCVLPFAARPMLTIALGMDEPAFQRFLDERRAQLPGFILNALRP
jgi:TetR/AcrR family transcriptional regulator